VKNRTIPGKNCRRLLKRKY